MRPIVKKRDRMNGNLQANTKNIKLKINNNHKNQRKEKSEKGQNKLKEEGLEGDVTLPESIGASKLTDKISSILQLLEGTLLQGDVSHQGPALKRAQ